MRNFFALHFPRMQNADNYIHLTDISTQLAFNPLKVAGNRITLQKISGKYVNLIRAKEYSN